ncbi:MAG: acetylxylan esterase [Myxococcota bacterium]
MKRSPVWCVAFLLSCGGSGSDVLPTVEELPEVEQPPDALVTFEGDAVASAEEWTDVRRPEVLRLFRHYVYGFEPADVAVTATTLVEEADVDGANYEEVELRFGPADAPPIHLAIFRPPGVSSAPVFLALNKCGNQSISTDARIRATEVWMDESCGGTESRGIRSGSWPIADIVGRGYALATFHESDVDPDTARDRNREDGIHPHFVVDEEPDIQWGTIAAWSYGLRRAVDHLVNADGIDGARISLAGHSRRGKAALWATAVDERIALVVSHQSGTGGATLSRSFLGESVEAVNLFFPHWFNDVFPTFGGNETRLPLDQHLLLALVAPRNVLITNGADDDWADPPGALRAAELADPVWELLGDEGFSRVDGEVNFGGSLSWFERDGGHSFEARDWGTFLDYADARL